MNAEQFFEFIAKMREAQKVYLQESKRLEESTFGSGREHP